jgi:prepilin-type processing-associated H-X9-DG protein
MSIRIRRFTGLTILELLVSVSVITMLAALLLPAVLQGRAVARRTACQANLRQWLLAVHMYADAHDGRLPRRGQGVQPTTVLHRQADWFNALPPIMHSEPYVQLVQQLPSPRARLNGVWICPEAIEPEEETYQRAQAYFPYGMNMTLSTWLSPQPDHIERVGPKQTLVFMADSKGPFCSVLPSAADYRPMDRHFGTVNLAFLDGRVEPFVGEDIGNGTEDPPLRPDIRWFPPNSVWKGPPIQ